MSEHPAHELLKVKSWGTLDTVAPPTDLNKMISFERKRHALIHRDSFKRLDEAERSRRELELSDYRDQADPEMNSEQARAVRAGLIKHKLVAPRLKRFYFTFQNIDPTHGITQQEYVDVHMRMSKALLPKFNEDSERRLALKEWKKDSDGAHGLSQERLCSSLFELVDLWTEELDPKKYAEFLDALYDRITVQGTRESHENAADLPIKQWQTLSNIASMTAEAVHSGKKKRRRRQAKNANRTKTKKEIETSSSAVEAEARASPAVETSITLSEEPNAAADNSNEALNDASRRCGPHASSGEVLVGTTKRKPSSLQSRCSSDRPRAVGTVKPGHPQASKLKAYRKQRSAAHLDPSSLLKVQKSPSTCSSVQQMFEEDPLVISNGTDDIRNQHFSDANSKHGAHGIQLSVLLSDFQLRAMRIFQGRVQTPKKLQRNRTLGTWRTQQHLQPTPARDEDFVFFTVNQRRPALTTFLRKRTSASSLKRKRILKQEHSTRRGHKNRGLVQQNARRCHKSLQVVANPAAAAAVESASVSRYSKLNQDLSKPASIPEKDIEQTVDGEFTEAFSSFKIPSQSTVIWESPVSSTNVSITPTRTKNTNQQGSIHLSLAVERTESLETAPILRRCTSSPDAEGLISPSPYCRRNASIPRLLVSTRPKAAFMRTTTSTILHTPRLHKRNHSSVQTVKQWKRRNQRQHRREIRALLNASKVNFSLDGLVEAFVRNLQVDGHQDDIAEIWQPEEIHHLNI